MESALAFVNGSKAPEHSLTAAEAEQGAHPGRGSSTLRRVAEPLIEGDGAAVSIDDFQPNCCEARSPGVVGDYLEECGANALPPPAFCHGDAVQQHLARSWRPLEKDHKRRAPKCAQYAKASPEIGGFASDEPTRFVVKAGEADQLTRFAECTDGVLRAHDRNKKRLRPVASPYDRAKLLGEGVEVKPRGGGAKMFRQADLEGRARRSGHQAAAILARIASVISVVPTLFPPVTVIRSGVR